MRVHIPRPVLRRRPAGTGVAVAVVAGVALVASVKLLTDSAEGPSHAGAYTLAQRRLLAVMPTFAEGCRPYSVHGRASAGVKCRLAADHPGAASLLYRQYTTFGDLQADFQRAVRSATQGQPAASAPCSSRSDFLAVSVYPMEGQQQSQGDAHGELLCFVDHGVPRLVWTNAAQLVEAEAVADDTGTGARSALLALWEQAGPTGAAPPGSTPEQLVRLLYRRYLEREPESGDVVAFWSEHIASEGLTRVSDDFAESSEARLRFVVPQDAP